MDEEKKYLTREEVRQLMIAGLAMYLILMVGAVGLWIRPKYREDRWQDSSSAGESIAMSDSSSEQVSSSETPPTESSEEETVMSELPSEWNAAAAQDYIQQMFLTDIASWCRVDQQEFQEIGQIDAAPGVMEKLNSSEYGIPGGIWFKNTELSKENVDTLLDVYQSRTEIAKGIFIAENYEAGADLGQLAQNLRDMGVDVNLIPASVDLSAIGLEAVQAFVESMHSCGISAGIYFPTFGGSDVGFGNGIAACKEYIEAGIDCIVMSSSAADSQGVTLCTNARYIELLRAMGFEGAILMEPVNRGTVSDAVGLVRQSLDAGCDGVSVLSIVGTSNRAKRVYNELIAAAGQGEFDAERLKASTLRIVALRR